MRLLVDLGNTRLKWARSAPGVWHTGAIAYRDQEIDLVLDEVWGRNAVPSRVVMVSVGEGNIREGIEQWIDRYWKLPVQHAVSKPEQFGIVNRYRNPATLGADRWAALIGARTELPSGALAVIGCGTAVTIDALTAENEFVGGVILPGLALMRNSLLRGTAGVRFDEGDEASCLARSTADAVAAGTLYGLVGGIERVCDEFAQSLGESFRLVITGGDADRFAAHLRRPARRQPDLVLRGLERFADTL